MHHPKFTVSALFGIVLAITAAWQVAESRATEPIATPAPIGESPTDRGPRDADPMEGLEASQSLGHGPVTDEQKLNFIRELARKQALYPNQIAGATPPPGMPVWHSIGPRTSKYSYNDVFIDGVDSGRMRDVLVDPQNADHVYLLTSGGGIWKTENFSAAQPKWTVLTDALLSTSGGAAALGRDANTIYLGIGDPFDVYPTLAGVMVKSSDGGKSWSPFVVLPGATAVRDVKVDTSGPDDVVLVATGCRPVPFHRRRCQLFTQRPGPRQWPVFGMEHRPFQHGVASQHRRSELRLWNSRDRRALSYDQSRCGLVEDCGGRRRIHERRPGDAGRGAPG